MAKCYLVVAKSAQGDRTGDSRHATVEDALRRASDVLGGGARAASIIDSEGNLILPADQVHLRLNRPFRPPARPLSIGPEGIASKSGFAPIHRNWV